jgi:hypothetical protein
MTDTPPLLPEPDDPELMTIAPLTPEVVDAPLSKLSVPLLPDEPVPL